MEYNTNQESPRIIQKSGIQKPRRTIRETKTFKNVLT